MLITKYLKNYLEFYPQINLPGIGTMFKKRKPSTLQNKNLLPFSVHYVLDEEISDNIQHFVMYILQFENSDFDTIHKQILSDLRFWKQQLMEDDTISIKNIGSLRYFKDEITLFSDIDNNENFGLPTLKLT